jgi:hypothetical protein
VSVDDDREALRAKLLARREREGIGESGFDASVAANMSKLRELIIQICKDLAEMAKAAKEVAEGK